MKVIISLLLTNILLFGYDLTILVEHLRNSQGVVQFLLYNKDGSIPDKDVTKYIMKKSTKIVNNSAKIVFKNLTQGRYAVNILHDENKNGKIDKGLFLPIEGVGFTNFKTINPLNKPNFKNTSFLLNKNITKKIKVIYF